MASQLKCKLSIAGLSIPGLETYDFDPYSTHGGVVRDVVIEKICHVVVRCRSRRASGSKEGDAGSLVSVHRKENAGTTSTVCSALTGEETAYSLRAGGILKFVCSEAVEQRNRCY